MPKITWLLLLLFICPVGVDSNACPNNESRPGWSTLLLNVLADDAGDGENLDDCCPCWSNSELRLRLFGGGDNPPSLAFGWFDDESLLLPLDDQGNEFEVWKNATIFYKNFFLIYLLWKILPRVMILLLFIQNL